MTLWKSIVGHDWATAMLQSALQNDRVGHAYLITGPDQIGKTSLARIFAMALNCAADDVNKRPCGACRSCKLISSDRHPDVRLLAPETSGRGKLTIKIDEIRELQHSLNLSAYEARHKIAILRRFDAANASAANAFLKTLEEPPRSVVLLLTAVDADTLLPTITSRCQTIALRPVPAGDTSAYLQAAEHTAPEQAQTLAQLAHGRIGWAVNAARSTSLMAERAGQIDILHHALGANRLIRFQTADKLAKSPEQLPDLLQTWLSWWRDLAIIAWSAAPDQRRTTEQVASLPANAIINIDQLEHLGRVAAAWNDVQILRGLKQTKLALWQLERNANSRLVIENLFLSYPLPLVA